MMCARLALTLLLAGFFAQAAEYVISHAPNNQQWTSAIYFRTDQPATNITLSGYTTAGGNGPGQLAWSSEALHLEKGNAIVTPTAFNQLIGGRAYDFLLLTSDAPLGEGKVNFSEKNWAHSTRVQALETYTSSANFNNITVDETRFAGLAFVVANPEQKTVKLRYRLSDANGDILAERTLPENSDGFSDPYYKVVALAQDLFPGVAIPENARVNVAVGEGARLVNGILLQGNPTGMYGGEAESVEADITFSKQISRIMQKHCQDCHHEGGSAPMPLTAFAEVKPFTGIITREVAARRMPPWKPVTGCGDFKYANILDDTDRNSILAWIRDGAPEGDPAQLPEPREFESGDWQIGLPDMEVVYSEPVTYAPGPDQYICLPVALDNPEPIQLEALEILPGNLNIVHHVILFATESDDAFTLDESSAEPGYGCFGSAGMFDHRMIGAWAPGAKQEPLPLDVGMTLPPYSTVILQMHYSSTLGIAAPENDQTRIGFHYAKTGRDKELQIELTYLDDFVIPANESNHVETDSYYLGAWMDIYMLFPHMHLIGKQIGLEVVLPNGSVLCALSIDDWDFNWQGFYYLDEPLHVPAGSVLRVQGIFDNSAGNFRNPNHPPKDVHEGEFTDEEMLVMGIGFVSPEPLDKRFNKRTPRAR